MKKRTPLSSLAIHIYPDLDSVGLKFAANGTDYELRMPPDRAFEIASELINAAAKLGYFDADLDTRDEKDLN